MDSLPLAVRHRARPRRPSGSLRLLLINHSTCRAAGSVSQLTVWCAVGVVCRSGLEALQQDLSRAEAELKEIEGRMQELEGKSDTVAKQVGASLIGLSLRQQKFIHSSSAKHSKLPICPCAGSSVRICTKGMHMFVDTLVCVHLH